jgi:hypothetical protein
MVSCSSKDDSLWVELVQLKETVAQQEDQIDKQTKVIRYLQAGQGTGAIPGADAADKGLAHVVEELKDENEELRQQVRLFEQEEHF